MTTTVEFYGGVREIGASKVLVSTDQARVLLDVGLPIAGEHDLLRPPVVERSGRELADRLRIGGAPQLPGVWETSQLPSDHPLAARDPRPTAIFLSHAHIDHDGCLGFVDPLIPAYAHPDTIRLQRALRLSGYRFLGRDRIATSLSGSMRVGDIQVAGIPVDHDIPGATGYVVTTPDGRLAYTGDFNAHRGTNTARFAQAVRGVDMLVTESTTLSWDSTRIHLLSEDEVMAGVLDSAADWQGLALVSLYERDVDRCQRLIQASPRRVVWPATTAVVLAGMGVRGVLTWNDSRPQSTRQQRARQAGLAAGLVWQEVGLAEVRAAPQKYLVQPDTDDPAALLDLPLGAGTPWIHAGGEPIGMFMPAWTVWRDWLAELEVAVVELPVTGHVLPDDLVGFIDQVAPGVVVPIHGERPEALQVEIPVLLAEYGQRYRLDGSVC